MNNFQSLFSDGIVQGLGWAILHSLWQGTIVAVLLALCLILLRKNSSKVRYFVSVAALSALFISFVVTFGSVYWQNSQVQTQHQVLSQFEKSELQAQYFTLEVISEKTGWQSYADIFQSYFNQHLPLIVTVWALGVMILMLRFLGAFAYLQRLKHYRARVVPIIWQVKVNDLAQQLHIKKAVKLMESAVVQVPMVVGFFKPVILVPVGTLTGLSAQQVESILAHELAHIYRNDYLVNLLQSIVEVLLFFNPLMWWISTQIREERENCCDDMAVQLTGDTLTFAKTLATVEEMRLQGTPELAMAFARKKGVLLSRIQRLTKEKRKNSTFSEGFLSAFLLLIFLFFASWHAKANYLDKMVDEGKKWVENMQPFFEKENEVTEENEPEQVTVIKTIEQVEEDNDERKVQVDDTIRFGEGFMLVTKRNGSVEVFKDGNLIPEDEYVQYETEFGVEGEEIRIGDATASPIRIKRDKPREFESLIFDFSDLSDLSELAELQKLESLKHLEGINIPEIHFEEGFAYSFSNGEDIQIKIGDDGDLETIIIDGEEMDEEDLGKYSREIRRVRRGKNKRKNKIIIDDDWLHSLNEIPEVIEIREEVMREFEEHMEEYEEHMREYEEEVRNHHFHLEMKEEELNRSLDEFKEALKEDGFYEEGDNLRLQFKNGEMEINGHEIPEELQLKYEGILENSGFYMGEDGGKFNINISTEEF